MRGYFFQIYLWGSGLLQVVHFEIFYCSGCFPCNYNLLLVDFDFLLYFNRRVTFNGFFSSSRRSKLQKTGSNIPIWIFFSCIWSQETLGTRGRAEELKNIHFDSSKVKSWEHWIYEQIYKTSRLSESLSSDLGVLIFKWIFLLICNRWSIEQP